MKMLDAESIQTLPDVTSTLPADSATPSRGLSELFVKAIPPQEARASFGTYVQASCFIVALAQIIKFVPTPKFPAPKLEQAISAWDSDIRTHLVQLYKAYEQMCSAGYQKTYEQIWNSLLSDSGLEWIRRSITLSDLYLDLKERIKPADAKSNVGLAKVSGHDYFRRTQFFTEPYMSRFLVDVAISQLATPLSHAAVPTVLDPACGTGNTLITALEIFVERLQGSAGESAEIEEHVFGRIVGYDLDPVVASICTASLAVAFAKLTKRLPSRTATILAGKKNDAVGFFSQRVTGEIRGAVEGNSCVLITNPPFLGRRLMDMDLKEYLKKKYPVARGDLCTAFIIKCADFLNEGDVLAVVHQSTFWHLDSLSMARAAIYQKSPLYLSVNLGSGAFRHLNGEKASVSLSIFAKPALQPPTESQIYDFSHSPLSRRSELLRELANRHTATLQSVEGVGGMSLSPASELTDALTNNDQVSHYGNWAVPMQGTSTGNSREAVRYSWEIPEAFSNWIQVSKGGGYCRWWGLNRYVVLWGKAGEALRRYSGSALRNVNLMDATDLVFSDTGTQGLNVRLRAAGQVFIASGPGIRITEGNNFSHLAFLNSRIASVVLRKLNPKLTIAAGYIKKLPFNETLAVDPRNAQLAENCVAIKQEILSRKLTNDDCHVRAIFRRPVKDFDAYFIKELLSDLRNENRKLVFEAEIDRQVLAALGISTVSAARIMEQVGLPAAELNRTAVSIDSTELDRLLLSTLTPGCQYKGRAIRATKFGTDGPLESLSYALGAHPSSVLESIEAHIGDLVQTKRHFLNDLLHKAALVSAGFNHNRTWQETEIEIQTMVMGILDVFPAASVALKECGAAIKSVDEWVRTILPSLHAETFFDRPFLFITGSQAKLIRSVSIE